jgi:hypothetical protein
LVVEREGGAEEGVVLVEAAWVREAVVREVVALAEEV